MNNKIINLTMRKAISYALNYSVFISLLGGTRCLSPITPSMLYSKWDVFNVPYYDVQTARQVLKDVGWNGTADLPANSNISSGNEWEQLVIDEKPLATYNFTYPTNSWTYEKVFNITSHNLKQIGVKIEAAKVTGEEYKNIVFHPELQRHKIELIFQGWQAPDLDPHNTLRLINALEPSFNMGQVNDIQLQQWIEDAIVEVNVTKRENLYYNIQQRLIEELFPIVWVVVNIYFDIFGPNVKGIQTLFTNPNKFVLKGVYFE
jgi:ABC-type transport system substrate-binding protein